MNHERYLILVLELMVILAIGKYLEEIGVNM
jgi:hypothetical protein